MIAVVSLAEGATYLAVIAFAVAAAELVGFAIAAHDSKGSAK